VSLKSCGLGCYKVSGSTTRVGWDPQLGMISGSDEILESDGSSAGNAPLARDGISRTRVLQGIQVNYSSRVGSSARMDPQLGMICGSDEILDSDGSSTRNAPLARMRSSTQMDHRLGMHPWLGMVSRVLGCYKVSGSTTRVGWSGRLNRLGPNDFDGP
jgi:hypothetical protein